MYQSLDEEICKLEELCPGPRLTTIEAWIKYLESKQRISANDIIQLPLHMLDDEFSEEQDEAKYNRRTRLDSDVQSLAKVRQVCMFNVLFRCLRECGFVSTHRIMQSSISYIITNNYNWKIN